MSTKRKEISKQRQTISLEKKIEILDKLKSGQGSTFVAKEYGMNEATVRTIKRMEDSIRKSVASGTSISVKLSSYKRNDLIETVEKVLLIWLQENSEKKVPIDSNSIRNKARNIFNALKENQQTPSAAEFIASKGWFQTFKKRHNLHNIQLKGEIAFSDEKSTKLTKTIEEKSYIPDQEHNADETCLLRKKMPTKTYYYVNVPSSHDFKLKCLKNDELLQEQYSARTNMKGEFNSPSTGIDMEKKFLNIDSENIEMQDDEQNCFLFENNEKVVYSMQKSKVQATNEEALQEIKNKLDNIYTAITKLQERYLAKKDIKEEFMSPSTSIEMENPTVNIEIENIEMQNDEQNCFLFENNEEIAYSMKKSKVQATNEEALQEIKNKLDNNYSAIIKLNENKYIHKRKSCKKAKEKNSLEEIGNKFKNNTTAVIEKGKPYKTSLCHLCGKFYDNSTPARAEYHTNLHTGARPYVCELSECGKAFPAKFLLQRHFRQNHTSRRPHECDICGRKYRLKNEVTRHRTVHFEPQLPCPVCGKLFKNKNGIRHHMATHTKNRRHQCGICSKYFQYPAILKAHHQRVHTKEK